MRRIYFISETGRAYVHLPDGISPHHEATIKARALAEMEYYRECTREEYQKQARRMRTAERREVRA